nr:venom peptide [Acharia stimulea]
MTKLCLLICVLVLVCIFDYNNVAAQKRCQTNAALCFPMANKCCKVCIPFSLLAGACM